MRQAHVPDGSLRLADVPAPEADVDELVRFGHRYHAYRVAGSLPRVAAIAVELHDRWTTTHGGAPDAVVDASLAELRIALFHTARVADHVPAARDDDTVVWLRVLVRSVRSALAAADRS